MGKLGRGLGRGLECWVGVLEFEGLWVAMMLGFGRCGRDGGKSGAG